MELRCYKRDTTGSEILAVNIAALPPRKVAFTVPASSGYGWQYPEGGGENGRARSK